MPPVIDLDKCTSCGICEEVCPGDILFLDRGKEHLVRYPWECDHCAICRIDCPEEAVEIVFPLDQLCAAPSV